MSEPENRGPAVPVALPAHLAYPLAILTGVLYFLGFPGIDLWPLSLVAFVPLIVALAGQPVRRAVGLGWLAGFTMTMTGFYWLLHTLREFSGLPVPICLLLMMLLCAYQGGRIALCAGLYGRAISRGWPAPVVFALSFAVSEQIYPLVLPWYFGASVHSLPVLLQCADLGGPILVGLVLVAANLAVAEVVLAWRQKRAICRLTAGAGLVVPLLAVLYGVWRIQSVDQAMAQAPLAQIGIVQSNRLPHQPHRSVPIHKQLTRTLREQGAELAVWSEAAIQSVYSERTYQEDLRRGLTSDLGIPTLFGTLLRVERTASNQRAGEKPRIANSALLTAADGQIVGRYDKQDLLAFGEYLPFGDRFPALYKWFPNVTPMARGTSMEPLLWGEHRIAALICYEDLKPALVNRIVQHASPDLLVNLTNDAWFGDSTEPWIHLRLAQLRAVEQRRFLVRATNSGVSAIVDAKGSVVTHGGTFKQEAIVGPVRFLRGRTAYGVVGDFPWYAATVILLILAILPRHRIGSEKQEGLT